jgi:hypothetical protein
VIGSELGHRYDNVLYHTLGTFAAGNVWKGMRRIHKSLHVTSAMQAGISDHIWALEEIATLGVLNKLCELNLWAINHH